MLERCGLAFVLLVLAGISEASAAPVPAAKPAPGWEPLLNWLPEDTETIIVAPLGFEIPKEEPKEKPKSDYNELDFTHLAPSMPAGRVMDFKDGFLGKQLAGQNVLCVVEGSRRFTKPEEFGLMPYEGCHILQFDRDADAHLKKIIKACQDKATKHIELDGVQVSVFVEDATWSHFVCRPRPGILICATNQSYLEETLKRIDRKPGTRALPDDRPEWKHVDTKAHVWGIRHYREEFAQEDLTSPLCRGGGDPQAVGITFWTNASGKGVEVRYLSGAKDAVKLMAGEWNSPAEGLKPKIKQGVPGVVEITDEKSGVMMWLILLSHLGHCIVV